MEKMVTAVTDPVQACAICGGSPAPASSWSKGKNVCGSCQGKGHPRWIEPAPPAESAFTVTTGRAGEPECADEHQDEPSPATATTEPETATAEPSAPRSVSTEAWRTHGSPLSVAERQRRWRRRHPLRAARNMEALIARSRERAKTGDNA